jgi:hypothetical protein
MHNDINRGHSLEDYRIEGLNTPNGLLQAEEQLLSDVRAWAECEISRALPEAPTDSNTVRAKFIRFLVLEGDNRSFVHEKGVQLAGVCIVDELDFHGCEIKRPLFLRNCRFSKAFILRDARASTIRLDGSNVDHIDAQRARISGSLYLHRCKVARQINLIDADVSGSPPSCWREAAFVPRTGQR